MLHFPKQVKEIFTFEKDLITVVKNIKFRNGGGISNNTSRRYKTKKTMPFADESSNVYRLAKEEHNKLLRNAITSQYKSANTKIKRKNKF